MKTVKRFLFIALTLAVLLCGTVIFASAAGNISEFGVTATVGTAQVQIDQWENGGKYYLFLPADANTDDLTVHFTASDAVTLNGQSIADGDTIALAHNQTYTLACGGSSQTFTVLQSANIPSLHITTESGSMDAVHADKSHKEKAGIVILSDGEVVLEKDLEYIKGRGNSTWVLTKKPYNIKFDKKTDLFGMGKAKKWSLLANYLDDSDIRNHIALNLAQDVGLAYTSNHVSVDLFINNEYYGNYLLCESVEVGETRVDITDLEGNTEDVNDADLDSYSAGGAQVSDYKKLQAGTQKWLNIPNDPDDISGGYLLEFELPNRYVNEASGFITNRNQAVVLKSPEYASEAQVKYISALYQEFEDAVFSETGYNSLGKHYTEYIDTESFVTMYVFQEYVRNLDAGISSFYIYKDADSDVFKAAPVWDFDYAMGNSFSVYGTNLKNATGWWAGVIYYRTDNAAQYLPTILNALFRHEDFFLLAADEWQNVFAPLLSNAYMDEIKAFSETITESAVMNAIRWETFSTTTYDATVSEYKNYVDNVVIKFLKQRKTFLNSGLRNDGARVFLHANGGTGAMFHEEALHKGETWTAPYCEFDYENKVFVAWNTAADGSGTSYAKGDVITLENTSLNLYAQWRDRTEEDMNFFEKIMAFFTDLIQKIRDFFNSIF